MRIKDALSAAKAGQAKANRNAQLQTIWSERLPADEVPEGYPRPQLRRDDWICLNGWWHYAFTEKGGRPETFDGKILVPFSPECSRSGVNRQLQPGGYLWYFRSVMLPEAQKGKRLLLHFGAVDERCIVWWNGKLLGSHRGGYLPFTFDVTELLHEGKNTIWVRVQDDTDAGTACRGKQTLHPEGMFYTAQSGIWQTVWLEYVPSVYINKIVTQPDLDKGNVTIRVECGQPQQVEIRIETPRRYDVCEHEKMNGKKKGLPGAQTPCEKEWETDCIASAEGQSGNPVSVQLPVIRPWTCEAPYLYYFTVKAGADEVRSYFALRTFTVEKDEGDIPRICLNHEPQFQKGVLDQGYWPDGLYTAPEDDALVFDIQAMKDMGFNMIRKHIKIEPQRWYYHCDRLGMVVWQDMVNGGGKYRHWYVTYLATLLSWMQCRVKDIFPGLLARTAKEGRLEFVREMKETVDCLKGHPSIAVWVIFNEGWGQFQTADMTEILRREDSTRLIDQASGWFDQGGGDFQSLHNYFFPLHIKAEAERATVLSEYGGYTMKVEGHCASEKEYGYGQCRDAQALSRAYRKREQQVEALIPEGLCASVYTQVSDIEEEINGIFTYDREVQKIRKA